MGNKLPKPNIPRPNINIPRPTLPKFLQKDSAGAAAAGAGENEATGDNKDNVPKIVENDASAAAGPDEVNSLFLTQKLF